MAQKYNRSQSKTYNPTVLDSEQKQDDHAPRSKNALGETVGETLVRQAKLRDSLQAAIAQLLREYELTTGFRVVRLDYQSEKNLVIVDAIPAPR